MTVVEALSAFIEHEEREHLFDRTALGVHYWQAIRHDVFSETLQALGLAERGHLRLEDLPMRDWLPQQLRELPCTLRRSIWRGLPRAELLVANHPRHVSRAGELICPYTQPLLDGTKRSRVMMEGQFQGRYATPGPRQPTIYVDLPLVLSHLRFRADELRGRGLDATTRSELTALRSELGRALGAAPPLAAITRRVRTAVLATRGLTPRYERLLDRVQPKLVVQVIGYRLVHQILTQVAHRRGLPVAEIQHGTLGPAHPAYNFAPGRRPESFPDYLLLFGALWRAATPGLPLPAANTPAIGYGWLDLAREASRPPVPETPRRVLFLSQRSIGAELSRVAAQLRALSTPEALHITYRLHPSEQHGWRDAYPELARSSVEVQTSGSQPLYDAQRSSHAQVGVYSTALLEGMAFDLATYVVALPGHEQLQFVIDAGHATRVVDAGSLLSALCEPRASTHATPDSLWAPHASASFAAFLATILDTDRR